MPYLSSPCSRRFPPYSGVVPFSSSRRAATARKILRTSLSTSGVLLPHLLAVTTPPYATTGVAVLVAAATEAGATIAVVASHPTTAGVLLAHPRPRGHAWTMPWCPHAPGAGIHSPRPGGPFPFAGMAMHYGGVLHQHLPRRLSTGSPEQYPRTRSTVLLLAPLPLPPRPLPPPMPSSPRGIKPSSSKPSTT